MKSFKFLHFKIAFLILPFMLNTSCAQEKVEGLLYLDGKPVSILIRNGKIAEVKRISSLPEEAKNLYIAPGLFDNQVNGFDGISFAFGGGELTEEGVFQATKALWERGVTTYLPTLTTDVPDLLLKNFAVLAKAKNNKNLLGSIPGFHLEGPFISPVEGYRGAHSPNYVSKPDWDKFMQYYKASGNSILTVTVAPEVEGGQEMIKKLNEKGIVVAIGHHNGTSEDIDLAVKNGARISTHLGNGCANMINRHFNPLWPQLANDDLSISIICDGFHLLPEEIKVFYKVKGPEKTIITSDVTKYANMKPGIYKNIDGEDIELTEDGVILYPAQKVLAGSASSIDKGVGHIMEVTGCSLAEAIRMASTNPAELYNITDRGTIEKGKRADLILFTMDDYKMNIKKTLVEGKVVYDSTK